MKTEKKLSKKIKKFQKNNEDVFETQCYSTREIARAMDGKIAGRGNIFVSSSSTRIQKLAYL